MLQVIYKRGKIPLVLFRFLKKKKKKNTRNFIVTACNKKPRRGADDSHGPRLSGLSLSPRQPLPAPHSRSLQVILNPPADRGLAQTRAALLARGSPGRVPGWGHLHRGARTLGPLPPVSPTGVRTQRSSPSSGRWR